MKKSVGLLPNFDAEYAVKQIKSGDTTVVYAVADGVSPVDNLIDWLIKGRRSEIITYRRLSW